MTRNDQGRFVLKLPFKEEILNNLGLSRDTALKRFHKLEERFHRDPNLKSNYTEFMNEYITLGHMKLITEQSSNTSKTYHLPHHSVFKDSPQGPKLRVVFDGSCRTDTGFSLNDTMNVGPVVQEDLMAILMRFRTLKYVLTADVIKMYRQIQVHPSQTQLQRVFWRDKVDSNLQVYKLTTVTYGTSAASYLATRCLQHLAELYVDEFPIGSAHVQRDFYIDDLLTGANSIAEALIIRDQIVNLLKQGSFELSKWESNCPALLEGVDDQPKDPKSFDKTDDFRILGILWDRENDVFLFSCRPSPLSDDITKRTILSEVSKLFDPLGILGPIIVIAKLILQDLWQAGIDWDKSIPQDSYTKWLQLKLQLPILNQLRVPRCVKNIADPRLTQIHGFCDASQRAYGACVYLRTRHGPCNYQSNLLCAKSRVAPLKALSLPRLELSAALLLSQLVDKIRSSIDLSDIEMFL